MTSRNLSVLIVDDEPDMRWLLRHTINQANDGLQVLAEASDGAEGVDQWREHRPDVVVLDQRMPMLTGLEAAGQILAEEPTQPLVLFSAFLTDDIRREAAEIGISACVQKDRMATIPEVLWGVALAG